MISSKLIAISLGAAQAFWCAASIEQSTPVSGGASSGFVKTASNGTLPQTPGPEAVPLTAEMRGDIFMAEKRFREAAEMYRDNAKNSAVMLNKTGIAYHQLLQVDMAEKYYKLAIRADSKYAEPVNNLGTVYYYRKSYRRAVNEYKRAIRLEPQAASMWSNLALAYFSRNDIEHAREAFQTAVKLDPEVFEHHGTQGVLLQESGVGDRSRFHFYLAQTYAKAGRVELALQYIRKALEEGFKERKKFQEDPAFAEMKELPAFKELMASEPRVL